MKALFEIVKFEASDIITASDVKQCPTDLCPDDCADNYE